MFSHCCFEIELGTDVVNFSAKVKKKTLYFRIVWLSEVWISCLVLQQEIRSYTQPLLLLSPRTIPSFVAVFAAKKRTAQAQTEWKVHAFARKQVFSQGFNPPNFKKIKERIPEKNERKGFLVETPCSSWSVPNLQRNTNFNSMSHEHVCCTYLESSV